MKVGVVIGTFGDLDEWGGIAERALASVEAQTRRVDDYCWMHADTLQEARNQGAERLDDVDWLIFLDADDELDPHYVEEMERQLEYATEHYGDGYGILRPSTIGVYEDGSTDSEPVMIPVRDLRTANCIVIGALCPSKLFFEVGGFREYPILEDWALWRAMVARGAWVLEAAKAVYRVHVRPGSRNTDQRLHGEIYRRILTEVPL